MLNKQIFRGVVAILLSVASSWSLAAPLNLDLTQFDPDLTFSFGNTSYDAVTDVFSIEAFAVTLASDTDSQGVNGSFSLTAVIEAGGTLTSGSISITGTTSGGIINATSGTLLTADLIDFGFASNGILEFVFDPTGGDLASFYDPLNGGGAAGNGGIIASVTGYNGDNFNSNFAGPAFGTMGDVAPIPVPAAFWLFGSALLGTLGIARRNR